MSNDSIDLYKLLQNNKQRLLEGWQIKLKDTLSLEAKQSIGAKYLLPETREILGVLVNYFLTSTDDVLEHQALQKAKEVLNRISSFHAKQEFPPSQTASFLICLKETLIPFFEEQLGEAPSILNKEVIRIYNIIDNLILAAVDAYAETREKVIKEQSEAIMELSTPIIKLWDKILLLPLVGVIDTPRAARIIEDLLQAVFDYEAHVSILDVTGVPVIDTRVAQHLIQTVTAAQMLGANVIVTGISPDMAQTLIKLDINLVDIKTKGTLAAGVAESFRLLGKNVQDNSSQKGL